MKKRQGRDGERAMNDRPRRDGGWNPERKPRRGGDWNPERNLRRDGDWNPERKPRRDGEQTGEKPFRTAEERIRESGQDDADGVIEGRNAVLEALRAGIRLDKVYMQKGATDRGSGEREPGERQPDAGEGNRDGILVRIAGMARASGAVVVDADRRKLDAMSRTHAHQGVIALAAVREYASVEDLLELAARRGEPPLIVVCDGISDPRNLGAIVRAAECAGAHGVIVPKRRSAGLTAVVAKASAGAVSYLPVARVPNIPAVLKDLKKRGVWVYGADAAGTTALYDADLHGAAAIVIGSEGDGMSRLTAETCDVRVSIPMKGQVNSLNASAACAVLLYEAVRQRSYA